MERAGALNIRAVEARDVDAMLAIQKLSPEIAQWTAYDYERIAHAEMAGWIAEEADDVAGFLVARRAGPEIEILNLAVRPEKRRTGVGISLFRAVRIWAEGSGAEQIHLEVRASNQPAVLFYKRCGFLTEGRRPHYYSAPVEDALLLTLRLTRRPGKIDS